MLRVRSFEGLEIESGFGILLVKGGSVLILNNTELTAFIERGLSDAIYWWENNGKIIS